MDESNKDSYTEDDIVSSLESIAIVGWSGRFPGADNIDSYWKNIRDGEESIDFYSEEELLQAGIPLSVLNDPNYVKAGARIKDAEMFDADFFAFTPRESVLMDPQHRVFLESAWHALENAGIDNRRCAATIGVFAGTNPDNYMHAYFNEKEFTDAAPFDKRMSSDSGFFATRIAYKLNLKGPALTIETACSTSLVTICVACQHLMSYQCDVALAGAATVQALRKSGYLFQAHGVNSPDGHCRAFDKDAQGTIGGEGVATVVLKRLEDALAEGDTIHAVIKGWALNNDGNQKVGFTAPSVEGQAEVIEMAQALAGVTADSIGYLEAHGTGTDLGDPIEVAALTQAFSATTSRTEFCALGSVKANIGHLDATAGIAGFIKAALVLKHKQIPALLHYREPNPKINFQASPFYVNTRLEDWGPQDSPRRAGISSFGMGGTNAHVVLEESPDPTATGASRSQQLLVVSAGSKSQCNQAFENLASWLESHPEQALADVAFTLQTGRRQFDHSAACIAENHAEAIVGLRQLEAELLSKGQRTSEPVDIVFMFPGQGNQYINMGSDLYQSEPVFREIVDDCSDMISAEFGFDLREIIYPSRHQDEKTVAEIITRTEFAQPALFVIEYAMARLLVSWGIQAQAFIGHSIGEYVAATLAGVFSLGDALKLVVQRGRLMQSVAPGAMAAIPMAKDELLERLPEGLSIAAINEPDMCVVSGVPQNVSDFVESCEQVDMHCYQLHTSHAFHSVMMEEILEKFSRVAASVDFSTPEIPFLSNLSGDWITEQQAMDPQYWVNHLRQTVLFNDGLQALLRQPSRLFYEVGPGNSLSSIAQRHPERGEQHRIVTSMRHPLEQRDDLAVLLQGLGRVWQSGAAIDWSAFYQNENRTRIPLPGYPFARNAYWIQPAVKGSSKDKLSAEAYTRDKNISNWFYVPSWVRQPATSDILPSGYPYAETANHANGFSKSWLIFDDQSEFSEQLVACLKQKGDRVIAVSCGETYQVVSRQKYTVSTAELDFIRLIEDLIQDAQQIDGVVYLWTSKIGSQIISSEIESSFYIPLFLVKALNQFYEKSPKQSPLDLHFITEGAQQIIGNEDIHPAKSLVLGLSKVSRREMPHLRARCIDLEICDENSNLVSVDGNVNFVLSELSRPEVVLESELEIAYRGQYRWVKTIESMPVKPQIPANDAIRISGNHLKPNGVYLITGGLGGIGRALSEYLAENYQARLILTGRKKLPQRTKWDDWVARHDDADDVSQNIKFIRSLESRGAQVLNFDCDVADFDAMTIAIDTATEQFGGINGVIHSAGVPAGGLIQLKDRQSAAEILAPKVQGALVLEALFENQSLDFMVFCSSLTAILGSVGQVDYTAANIFLDSLAMQRHKRGLFTVSINWDTWAETGMAVQAEMPSEYQDHFQKMLDAGIRTQEGVELFCRILNQKYPQIIVSTRALQQRIVDQATEGFRLEHDAGENSSSESLSESYIAPRNGIESALCDIWQEMFGIARIGVDDNFFELGGHSLLAIQILSRINDTMNTNISLNDFFDAVTISNLARIISQQESSLVEMDAVKSTDEMVDALSDEEVERLLADKGIEIHE